MVRTRSACRVRATDKVSPEKAPGVQVTFSTDDITTGVPKQPDDRSSHVLVETCCNLDEGASSSSISSDSIVVTPSRPVVEIETDSCSSAVSFQSGRPKTRSRPRHDIPFPSANQRVTRSQQKALSQARNTTEELVSSSKRGSESETPCVSRHRSARSKKIIFYPSDDYTEELNVQSPVGSLCSAQGGETPSSSRTGSGYSSCDAPSTSGSVRNSTVINSVKPVEESNSSPSDGTSGQRTDEVALHLTSAGPSKTIVPSKDDSNLPTTAAPNPKCVKELVHELGIITEDQQVDLPAVSKVLSAEPSEPCQFVTGRKSEKVSEFMVESEEKQQEANTAQSVGPVFEAAVVESKTKMGDSETMVEPKVDFVHVTPDQQHDIVAESVHQKKMISLLDSSDEDDECDEEEEDEKMEVSEERETSKSTKVSAASVDGLFMIDTRPGNDMDDRYYKDEGEEVLMSKEVEEEEEFVDEGDDDGESALLLFSRGESHLKALSSSIDPSINIKDFGGLHITFDGTACKPSCSSSQKQKKIQDDVMKKSVIGPDFEKKDAVPAYSHSKHAKAEREKTTGEAWFNMKAPELTQEMKQDLQVLKMRGALDFKRFYKKSDREAFPKFFQFGTVVDSPIDYHSRIPKKERKRTMVEELLADAEFRQNNKKKYQKIIAERSGKRKKIHH